VLDGEAAIVLLEWGVGKRGLGKKKPKKKQKREQKDQKNKTSKEGENRKSAKGGHRSVQRTYLRCEVCARISKKAKKFYVSKTPQTE